MKRYLLTMLTLILCGIGSLNAQDTPTLSPELETHLEQLDSITEELRGLDSLSALQLRFPTRDEVRQYVMSLFEEQVDTELIAEQTLFYQAFDLIPLDLDLTATLLDFYGQQVGGYYDPETDEMNVLLLSVDTLGDRLPVLEQTIYVHEYIHALQDQHFNLEALLRPYETGNRRDEGLAVLSLVEGDATAVMNVYTTQLAQRNPIGTLMQLTLGSARAGVLTLPPGLPNALERELLFPYMQGEVFVRALYQDGGWERVNAAFDNPPQSSEHILHPDKYLAGEAPVQVILNQVGGEFGGEWQHAQGDTLGEFYLREYLRTQLPLGIAQEAAAGWGGDTYHIYTDTQGRIAWHIKIAWDSFDDMIEFREAFADFAASRTGATAQNNCWSNETLSLCLISGMGETMLSAAPTLSIAQFLSIE